MLKEILIYKNTHRKTNRISLPVFKILSAFALVNPRYRRKKKIISVLLFLEIYVPTFRL